MGSDSLEDEVVVESRDKIAAFRKYFQLKTGFEGLSIVFICIGRVDNGDRRKRNPGVSGFDHAAVIRAQEIKAMRQGVG